MRTPALIAGGWVPKERRGTQLSGLVHISDLYATFCSLAGLRTKPTDTRSARGCPFDEGPAEVDALDMSAFWLEAAAHDASPRVEIVHDLNGYVRRGNRSGVVRSPGSNRV